MSHDLLSLCQRLRYDIVTSTTEAGSGHPTSSLSAVELMTTLFFGGYFKQDISNFENPLNDKFILSKGHAAPLLYALYETVGVLTKDELMTLRKFSSRLQGHPTPEMPFVDVTTGSLGQGLSVGVGMALGLKKKFQSYQPPTSNLQSPRVFVLLGDSEFAEGQNYEALQLGSYYKLNNLVGILDVNRLGQRGETQLGWDIEAYQKRVESFGWNTVVINNGHDLDEIQRAFSLLLTTHDQRPKMIIAKTKKGAGVSFMENADNWHGKPIPKSQLEQALRDIGEVDFTVKAEITSPAVVGGSDGRDPVNAKSPAFQTRAVTEREITDRIYDPNKEVSTREAYGYALADLAKQNKDILALDAETSNSTYAEFVKKETPDQFIECFIAEQNMVSMALGFSKIGYIPFVSSFAAFLSRAFDQIRMAQYSRPTLNIVGSHAGCSIGVDGASQMALEDISMMRSINKSTVLYPADAVSSYKLTAEMFHRAGINYLRTTREKLPILYDKNEEFPIGGCKVHFATNNQPPTTTYKTLIIAAGITVHEALKAQKILTEKQINTVVVDLYSVKPLDSKTISELSKKTEMIVVVEDHYEAGGIGEAVFSALSTNHHLPATNHLFTHLCVRKEPRSGSLTELLHYEEIDAQAVVDAAL